ncbi:MAG: polymer-forming cytoskeletal protein, partial [Acidobacteriota bacterium]
MTLGRALLLVVLLSIAPQVGAQGGPSDPSPADGDPSADGGSTPAYTLAAGSFARSRVVALGRDLHVDGEAMSHAVAISGDARVTGSVAGDLIVLGGVANLAADARVDGDVYVLGGDIELAPGAVIGGRSVAYPEASDLWVALIE